MSGVFDRTSREIYRGVWAVFVDLLRVPDQSPTLPVAPGGEVRSFQPAEGFLRYLKFLFWLVLLLVDFGLLALWLVIYYHSPLAAWIVALPMLALIILPDIVAYIAIHLRYDTTWYVLTDRSVRIRRGIWIISETTITFENVQNVTTDQGPLERYFGIANVRIQTAGGGGGDPHGVSSAHIGRIEGIADAATVRDLILARVRASRSAGLGDERTSESRGARAGAAWSPEAIALLREIRDLAVRAAV